MKITHIKKFGWFVTDTSIDGANQSVQVQVKSIDDVVSCTHGEDVIFCNPDNLFPIVVMEVDLLRNGFEFRQVTSQLKDFSLSDRRKVEGGEADIVTNISIRILDSNSESYDICIDQHLEWGNGQRKNIMLSERWGLLYVHHLQDYLREVGFEELADNFKMED